MSDGVVVPIPGEVEGTMAEWLRSLRRDQPSDAGMTGAELVDEARTEQ